MASLLSGICLGKPGKQCHKSGPVQGGCAGIEVLDPLWPPYWKATQISNDSRGVKRSVVRALPRIDGTVQNAMAKTNWGQVLLVQAAPRTLRVLRPRLGSDGSEELLPRLAVL